MRRGFSRLSAEELQRDGSSSECRSAAGWRQLSSSVQSSPTFASHTSEPPTSRLPSALRRLPRTQQLISLTNDDVSQHLATSFSVATSSLLRQSVSANDFSSSSAAAAGKRLPSNPALFSGGSPRKHYHVAVARNRLGARRREVPYEKRANEWLQREVKVSSRNGTVHQLPCRKAMFGTAPRMYSKPLAALPRTQETSISAAYGTVDSPAEPEKPVGSVASRTASSPESSEERPGGTNRERRRLRTPTCADRVPTFQPRRLRLQLTQDRSSPSGFVEEARPPEQLEKVADPRIVVKLSSWMSDSVIRSMRIWDVCLPGTHNSASWKLAEEHQKRWNGLVFSFLRLYIHCQDITIYQQMQLGVRFLDLRVCKHLGRRGEPFCAHGGFRTIPLKEVLQQIAAFLSENPTEVIVLSVRKDVAFLSGPASLSTVEADFWVAMYLKEWLGTSLEADVTIEKLATRQQNVIYFFEERERFLPPLAPEGEAPPQLSVSPAVVDDTGNRKETETRAEEHDAMRPAGWRPEAFLQPKPEAAPRRRFVLGTLLSPRKGSRRGTLTLGTLTSRRKVAVVEVTAQRGEAEYKSQSTIEPSVGTEVPPEVIPAFRPRRQLTRWMRKNVEKYWVDKADVPPLARLLTRAETAQKRSFPGRRPRLKRAARRKNPMREHGRASSAPPFYTRLRRPPAALAPSVTRAVQTSRGGALWEGRKIAAVGRGRQADSSPGDLQRPHRARALEKALTRRHGKPPHGGDGGWGGGGLERLLRVTGETAEAPTEAPLSLHPYEDYEEMSSREVSNHSEVERFAAGEAPSVVSSRARLERRSTIQQMDAFLASMASRDQATPLHEESEGYQSERSGITAVPAARAMQTLLGHQQLTPTSLEDAGASPRESVRDGAPPFVTEDLASHTPGALTPGPKRGYSNPDLRRLETQLATALEGVTTEKTRSSWEAQPEKSTGTPTKRLQRGLSAEIDWNTGFLETAQTDRDEGAAAMDTRLERRRSKSFDASTTAISSVVSGIAGDLEGAFPELEGEAAPQLRDLREAIEAEAEARKNEALAKDEAMRAKGRAEVGGHEVAIPLTPFVAGPTRIVKSWTTTTDPNPSILCKKLLRWAVTQGHSRPRSPFIFKVLAGEVTPPSFGSPDASIDVVRFWTVQGATALLLRNGGLRAAARETHRLLEDDILTHSVTNRVNGITHDFVSDTVVSRLVRLNYVAAAKLGKVRRRLRINQQLLREQQQSSLS